jgi:hypothetical protein
MLTLPLRALEGEGEREGEEGWSGLDGLGMATWMAGVAENEDGVSGREERTGAGGSSEIRWASKKASSRS